MALQNSELDRLRYELGFNTLSVGAEPYISYLAIFANVVQKYLSAGALTTCSTTVAAATSVTPVTLTLADATGFSALCRVVVDVDDRQEIATVQSLSGSTISVLLSGAHTGSYPVGVEGGESMVRDILRKIAELTKPGGKLEKAAGTAGVAKVDEIEFFSPSVGGAKSRIRELQDLRMYYRDELSAITGVPNFWRYKRGGGRVELY